MKSTIKIKRSFYFRPYPEAMARAKAYASQNGYMDWKIYFSIMARYEKTRQRQVEREVTFAEQLPLFKGNDYSQKPSPPA